MRAHIDNQALSRVNRLGQDAKVHVIRVGLDTDGEKNIIDRNLDLMEWSKEKVNQMLGNTEDTDGDLSMEGVYSDLDF